MMEMMIIKKLYYGSMVQVTILRSRGRSEAWSPAADQDGHPDAYGQEGRGQHRPAGVRGLQGQGVSEIFLFLKK